jgi:hypothetical protein
VSRLVWIIVVLVLVVGSIWVYNNTYGHKDQLGSGLVISHDSDSRVTSETAATDTEPPAPNPPPAATNATTAPAPQTLPPQPAPAASPAKPSAALPDSDSIAPNPPNGTVFTGTGPYTWYRQGNITWRVDSVTGSSCIAFATMEEWQKRIVYTHGCRNA